MQVKDGRLQSLVKKSKQIAEENFASLPRHYETSAGDAEKEHCTLDLKVCTCPHPENDHKGISCEFVL